MVTVVQDLDVEFPLYISPADLDLPADASAEAIGSKSDLVRILLSIFSKFHLSSPGPRIDAEAWSPCFPRVREFNIFMF